MLATVTRVANCFLVEMISHASPGTTLLKATLDRDGSATPFVITAYAPTLNSWPSFLVACCLTTLGVVWLATKRDLTP
jgi:hypothetical protein